MENMKTKIFPLDGVTYWKATDHIGNNVERIAEELAMDISQYTCGTGQAPINKYASTMRRCVEEIMIKHEYLFNGMMKKLDVNMGNADSSFSKVVGEMLTDGDVNWGRVISVYAFAGRLAKHLVMQKNTETVEVIRKVSGICGSVVASNLKVWIEKQGGWESFVTHFPEEDHVEKSVWRGLVLTAALGLGALATMAASRG